MIQQSDIDNYKVITRRFNDVIIRLGEYYMELYGLNKAFLTVDPNEDFKGFKIIYRDDWEGHSYFDFQLDDLIHPEVIREAILNEKLIKDAKAKEKKHIAEEATLDNEKKEYERLRAKFENKA